MPDSTLSRDQELCLLFARAIAKPRAPAQYIAETNAGGEQVFSLEAAARSNRAFMVIPRDGIIVADLDDEHDHDWAARARGPLEAAACQIVVTQSGRPGHGHMWIVAPPGWDNEYAKERLYEAGGPEYLKLPGKGFGQGRANMATRPPYAPHRDPRCGRSSLAGIGYLEARKSFQMVHPRDVSAAVRDKLQRFDPSTAVRDGRGTPSRSLTLRAAAVAAVNARWSFEDFLAEMQDPANETARLYFADNPHRRNNGWVDGVWRKSMKYVREHPARPSTGVAREAITYLLTCINDHEWSSRTGANDRAIYRALLETGMAAGRTEVTTTERRLSDATGVGRDGVRNALARLCERGFIRRVADGRRDGRGTTYQLCAVRGARVAPTGAFPGGIASGAAEVSTSAVNGVESVVTPAINSHPMGDRRSVMVGSTALLADIFTNGTGLGLSCRETWLALPTEPTKVPEVARLRPGTLQHRTVREQLKTLRIYGFAERDGHRWWRLTPDEDSLKFAADSLGVRNKVANRREKHRHETATFHRKLEQWGKQPQM